MTELPNAFTHSQACVATAEQVRTLFESVPTTAEKVAAHAFFCRCIDHFRAAVLVAEHGLDAEALALVRGMVETHFVIGALLTGDVSCEEMETFDLAGRAKGAKAQDDFLRRNASEELRGRVRAFADSHIGPTVVFLKLAEQIDAEDLYHGHYRMFSHIAAHPSISSIEKYLSPGRDRTHIVYPGEGRDVRSVVFIASTLLMHTCAAIEHWLGTTPAINQAIGDRLQEIDASRHA